MAYTHFNYKSKVLNRDISMEVSLPCYESAYKGTEKKFKTVYFLHGFSGSAENYMSRFAIRESAAANGLAVVAINGENLAYLDRPAIETYFSTWIGTELLDVTRSIFPLSDRREDTCIVGFSMGGYGAMVNGLRFPDRFGKICAVSGAFVEFDDPKNFSDSILIKLMGEAYEKSYASVSYAIETACENHVDLPEIYMACGTADFLFTVNEWLDKFLTEHGVSHHYKHYPDEAHTSQFIKKALPDVMAMMAEK